MKTFHQLKGALNQSNSELAKHLSVSERTIRYWVSGRITPKPSILRDLESLLAKRNSTARSKETG